jgi:multiple sugar transport system substrate-binding protein
MIRPVAIALLVSGCEFGGPGGSRFSIGSRTDAAALRLATRAPYGEAGLEDRLLEPYRGAHPGLPVTAQFAATDDAHRERLLTSLARGRGPDAFLLAARDVPALVGRGLILDLAPYLARVGVDVRGLDPAILGLFRRGGAVYALPRGYSPVVIAYNKDLFDRAGLDYPTDDWTWDDFLRVARLLTRPGGRPGAVEQWGAYADRRVRGWLPWLWSGGGDVLCAGGRRASGCLDSPTTIAALRWYTDWVTRDGIAPQPGGNRNAEGDNVGLLRSGRVAMLTVEHSAVLWLRSGAAGRLRVGFAELPHRRDFPRVTLLEAWGYAVAEQAARRQLAVELVASLTDSEAEAARGEAGLELPAATGAEEALTAHDPTGWEATFVRAAGDGRAGWAAQLEQWPAVEAVLPDLIDAILAGADPAQAARTMARRLDGLLGSAR